MEDKVRAPRNRTITLREAEALLLEKELLTLRVPAPVETIANRTIYQDVFQCIDFLPTEFVDLMFVDPPYNLNKTFNSNKFRETSDEEYEQWVSDWLKKLVKVLKPDASVYVCCDWKSSPVVCNALKQHLIVRNRITWEREKGRGAKKNWKNCSEDIWFATRSDEYHFNPDAVKLKRKVIAPYRDVDGQPKDWDEEQDGNFRLTHPSNFWTDITIPFWSMPENTDHPTQKPEKLVAKIILASSRPGDFVFDPFLGSGTTSVVAKKLGRQYCGVEIDKTYCLLAAKRLGMAQDDISIQGYSDGVFWERNSLSEQVSKKPSNGMVQTMFNL
jgi:site-specific DNA-methyltransferase (adenine-specific)